MVRRRTRGEAQIEALLEHLDPNSERYRILSATRDFKASWVALGEVLTVTRETASYKEWGYKTFEAYCRSELKIKADTANKLTRSFAFLRDHNPTSLENLEVKELPPLDVIDLLSRARERANLSHAQFSQIEGSVFDNESPPSKTEVLKRYRELDPQAFKPAAKPNRSAGDNDLRKALLLAERLQAVIEPHNEISSKTHAALNVVVKELRSLFNETTRTQPAAMMEQ
ncbi:MAG: hypothetical protein JW841_14630 [Deltaproteobacteria bacterium]|nr:hypothetical protein [Deltaproteobacteria bacterium]